MSQTCPEVSLLDFKPKALRSSTVREMMAVIPVLMTIEELSRVTFGHRSPRHGLKLLHWFSAECVKFEEDGDMELQCDPDNGDYGFHHYGNFEDLLPPCNTYFEVGNLNTFIHFGAQDLPAYVREGYCSWRNSNEQNKDRIIVNLDRATRLIGKVYITEHLSGLRDFDPGGTYLLSLNILRQAGNSRLFDFLTRARFSFIMNMVEVPGESFDSCLDSDKIEDEGESDSSGSGEWERRESRRFSPSSEKKKDSTTENDFHHIYPKCLYPKKQSMLQHPELYPQMPTDLILQYQESHPELNTDLILQHQESHPELGTDLILQHQEVYPQTPPDLMLENQKSHPELNNNEESQTITYIVLSTLLLVVALFLKVVVRSIIVMTLLYLTSPQLEVKTTLGGNALVTWHGMSKPLADSTWVGLFRGNTEPDESYLAMIQINGRTSGSYETSESLNRGLQVRLFAEFLSYSLWRGPEFDASGRMEPTPIPGFQASLQLYTENGYALARLYIFKTFTDWKSSFYYSWVGFYALDGDGATKYKTYQWVMSFTKETRPDIQKALDYNVYLCQFDYKRIAPGVQARFFTSRGYSEERTRTAPWEGGVPDL